jgi:hypothetical protein
MDTLPLVDDTINVRADLASRQEQTFKQGISVAAYPRRHTGRALLVIYINTMITDAEVTPIRLRSENLGNTATGEMA